MLRSKLFQDRVSAIYLYRPDLCTKALNANYEVLPRLNEQCYKQIKCIIQQYTDSNYLKNDFIFFTQPIVSQRYSQKQHELIDCLSKTNYAIKIHPLDNFADFCECNTNSTGVWEIDSHDVCENQILISAFSSALFTPKLLYGKEPYLIFTYKLFGKGLLSEKYISYIDRFSKSYTNKTKIFAPKDLLEFSEIIEKLNQQHYR